MGNDNLFAKRILEVQNELTDEPDEDDAPRVVRGKKTPAQSKPAKPQPQVNTPTSDEASQSAPTTRSKTSSRTTNATNRDVTAEWAHRFTRPTVPLTTRLQPQTAEALEQAHLDRRLKREPPFTKQDIAQQALDDWLSKHGYLK